MSAIENERLAADDKSTVVLETELDHVAGGTGFAAVSTFAIFFEQLANKLYERETGRRAP